MSDDDILLESLEEVEESDNELQAPKKPRGRPVKVAGEEKKKYNTKPLDPDRIKKPRTEKQIEAWNKALTARQLVRDNRKTASFEEKEKANNEIAEKERVMKEDLEKKIIRKAVSIKKKQIKKEILLDEISDDDTPMEEIRKIMKPKKVQPVRIQPERTVKQELIFY